MAEKGYQNRVLMYNENKKSIHFALLLAVFGLKHIYFGEWMKFILFIITGGGFGIWYIFTLFTAMSDTKNYNRELRAQYGIGEFDE